MKLRKLLQGIKYKKAVFIDEEKEIEHICYNSKDIKKGDIFVAIRGFKNDGNAFIPEALKNGAYAVVTENCYRCDFPCIEVEDARRALSRLSANYFSHPSKKLNVVGITGTNGKTTTSFLVVSMFKQIAKAGLIGTTGYFYDGIRKEAPVTTPESLDLQRLLYDMLKRGISYVSMEASAHGITLHRLQDVEFRVKVFTNISQDHLDFYKSMEDYARAKLSFFDRETKAVVNMDDRWGKEIEKRTNVTTYGFDRRCDIHPVSFVSDIHGIKADILTPLGKISINSPLVGDYNLYNIMACIGVGLCMDIEPEVIAKGIADLDGVPGRMEHLFSKGVDFFIDYAHTPDALKNALSALKKIKKNRLIVVFGAGGNRDREKRPIMGKVASELSDLIVLTSDNPRDEEPQAIINDIMCGIEDRKKAIVEPDRENAIKIVVDMAREGDAVLIAGKGHETYQIIGKKKDLFNDKEKLKEVLYDRL